MAEAEPMHDEQAARPPERGFRQRIGDARWLISAIAVLVIVLFALGLVSLAVAAILIAAVLLLVAAIPVGGVPVRSTVPAEPQQTVWPETSIKHFAEALPDPCFILDQRGIVRYANAGAASAFPIKPGDPLTFRLRDPELSAAFDRVAHGGEAERVEFSERVPTERWYAAWIARMARRPGEDFVVLVLDDLSERRQIDRVRVDFVANASHELRTPLASLAGFIETLQGSARDDAEARERFLAIMHGQATRMARLIDDLLSLSRIELKAHVRPSDEVDLVPIVRHIADSLEPMAGDLDVAIDVDLPSDPVNVVGDRDELIQVVENLVENAIKYGQSGERVVAAITPATVAAGAGITVRDYGPGIAEEHLPRLTERFYRIDEEASRKHRGTGLGLAIVKHILARHGAQLAIESRVGDGALFRVTFPQRDSRADHEESELSK